MLEYSVAVFAYNIASTLEKCVESLLHERAHDNFNLYILANGCTDNTIAIATQLQKKHPTIQLVNLNIADKANAWNVYVHQVAPKAKLHFFVDGDVQVLPHALENIAQQMAENTAVNAIGAVPYVGRDKEGWTQRMHHFGRVSGGLYGLSAPFMQELRKQEVLLPIGFIGEDFLISAIAKNMKNLASLNQPSPFLLINNAAGFIFKPLSKRALGDYYLYFRRLVRYRMRDYQMLMLTQYCEKYKTIRFPESVSQLYNVSRPLPLYYWRGKYTPIDWLALYKIKKDLATYQAKDLSK